MGRRHLPKLQNQFSNGSLNFETLRVSNNILYNNELRNACLDYLLQKILQSGQNRDIIFLGITINQINTIYLPIFTEERIELIKLITKSILSKPIGIRRYYFMRYLAFRNYYNWISKRALIIIFAALNLHNFKPLDCAKPLDCIKKSQAVLILFNKRFVRHIAEFKGM